MATFYIGWYTVCAKTDPVTAEKTFVLKVKEMGGDVKGKYINAYTNVEILCDNGHTFNMQPLAIKYSGQWCPYCSRSGGEKFMENVLQQMGYELEIEFRLFKSSKYRFDLKFEDKGRTFLLEVDGNQHFKYIPYIHKTYQQCVRNRYLDLFKTHTAIQLGYKVIRIDYSWVSKSTETVKTLIHDALKADGSLYVSDLAKYDWIVIKPDDFIESLKGTILELQPVVL
jgi:very-short-patch-repair endonuclease